jgi:hypothetical protein
MAGQPGAAGKVRKGRGHKTVTIVLLVVAQAAVRLWETCYMDMWSEQQDGSSGQPAMQCGCNQWAEGSCFWGGGGECNSCILQSWVLLDSRVPKAPVAVCQTHMGKQLCSKSVTPMVLMQRSCLCVVY